MNYELLRCPQALRQLRRLQRIHPPIIPLIAAAITALSDNPRPTGATKLVNRPEWRVRAGSYRVLYQIDDNRRTVTIVSIAHRRDAYR
jgi:mRNA interferase RelE/StbE